MSSDGGVRASPGMITVSNSSPLARNSVITLTLRDRFLGGRHEAHRELVLQRLPIVDVAARGMRAQQREEILDGREIDGVVDGRRSSEREPCAANAIGDADAAVLGEGGRENARDAREARAAVVGQPLDRVESLEEAGEPVFEMLAPRTKRSASTSPHHGARSTESAGEPIGGLQERVREAQQIEDGLPRAERVELDRRERNRRRAQRRQDRIEIAARAHQDRDVLRARSEGCVDVSDDARGLVRAASRRPRASAVRRRTRGCVSAAAANATAPRHGSLRCAEHAREHAVGPCHELALRAEVAREVDELRPGRRRCDPLARASRNRRTSASRNR